MTHPFRAAGGRPRGARTPAPASTPDSITRTVAGLRSTFASGRTRPLAWRRRQLAALARLVREHERDFAAALAEDLGRGPVDTWLADLAPVAAEARWTSRRLAGWTRPAGVGTPLGIRPGRSWSEPEPLGVVLIIGPWNYPVQLVLAPLVGAIAAGNCAVIKPSERTPATSQLLARLVPRYLDPAAFAVVVGGAAESEAVLAEGVDHCLFTGGADAGRAVMTSAAARLTPVTLELGGKSPVIVAADADIPVAARRVAWAKLFNAGQTCIAPDYVLVHRAVRDRFVDHLGAAIEAMTGGADLPLIDERQAWRMRELLEGAGGQVVRGGRIDVPGRRADLTVVLDPRDDSPLMREEIFGPILPVLQVDSVDDAVARVNRGGKPLALYVFSGSRTTARTVLAHTSSGSAVINHLMLQLLVNGLPFGGVGASGSGAYHGRWGFETFSHRKAVLRKPTWPDPAIAYPPYSAVKRFALRRLF